MQAQDPIAKLGKSFAWIAWLLILGAVYLLFDALLEQQWHPNQQLQMRSGIDFHQVILQRDPHGHYRGVLHLNQQAVPFLLDTGATRVAVSSEIAARTGMPQGRAFQTQTANGVTIAYQSYIEKLQLGDIVLTDLPASIVPNLTGQEILLGMSALKHLEFTQQANQLILTQRIEP